MTIAIACIAVAAFLPILCTGIAKAGAIRGGASGDDNRRPRDWLAKQTGYRARANAAQHNSWEALSVFAPAVLAAHWLHAPQARIDAFALLFIVARLLYIAAYVGDRAALRSIVWLVGYALSFALFLSLSFKSMSMDEPVAAAQGPLANLKVLELGTLIAGPFCARMLGEFGAEVIKIESPPDASGQGGGDPLRTWRVLHEGTSLWWNVQARNKKSIAIDLRNDEGRALAKQLALAADIVVENFRPGVLEKMGLGWDVLKALNPSLVMVRLSGYGQTGPMARDPGFGAIGESMGGLRYVSGYADRPPVRVGISIGDSLAALHGVIGALIAIHHRDATGGPASFAQGARVSGGTGQMIDVALYESVFNMMESLVPEYDVAQFVRERTGGSLPGIVPSNTYTTGDGENIVIAGNGDAIFRRLMRAIGRDDLAIDSALATNEGRVRRTSEIDTAIQDWCATQSIDAALASLKAADVPVSKIYSIADMVRDPQFLARKMFEQHRLPDGTPIRLPSIVPKLSETPGQTRWLGPALGAHTDEVLREIGLSSEQIDTLRRRGVVA